MNGPTQTAPADRLQLLDAVRLIAAIGVIVSHVTTELFPHSPLWTLGSFAVPFYLLAALYFTVRGFKKDPGRSAGSYLLGRVVKLYLPFLIWNVAYDVMHLVKYPGSSLTPLSYLVWAATYAHLYFLPLLAATTLLVVLLIRPILASNAFRMVFSVLLVAAACFCMWGWSVAPLPDDPMPQVETLWHIHRTLPPACLAIVFAIWAGTRDRAFRVTARTGLLGLALMAAALSYQMAVGPQPIMRTLSGLGLVLIAFTPFYSAALRPAAFLGRYSYGIYLSHVAFIRIGLTLADHFELQRDLGLAVVVGVFALVCGAVLSILLSQSAWTSWIVGCDVGSVPIREKSVTTRVGVSLPQTASPRIPDHCGNVPH